MGWHVSKKEKSYFCDGFVAFSLAMGQKSQNALVILSDKSSISHEIPIS